MAQPLRPAQNNAVWGGIMLSILGSLTGEELAKTVILAGVGTVVSFLVSAVLKILSKKFKK